MKTINIAAIFTLIGFIAFHKISAAHGNDSVTIKQIYNAALTRATCYENLFELCKNIGTRLSGSKGAEEAVKWSYNKLLSEGGADTVYLQPVMVPVWQRLKEEASIPRLGQKLSVCALGGSISTPVNGVTSSVIEVENFDELNKIPATQIEGKIVFFNHKMDKTHINTFVAYSENGKYRWRGALEAAKKGAVAVIVRSLTLLEDDEPHTGSMGYADSLPKIPAAAIGCISANRLSSELRKNKSLEVYLNIQTKQLPEALSYNVIAEKRGKKLNDIILVGGHLDSWDKGEGAHDDGAGVVQSFEVLHLFKQINYQPNKTIRVVAFMNEENGLRGAKTHAEAVKNNGDKVFAAIESDGGGFSPRGFTMEGPEKLRLKVKNWTHLFEPYMVHSFSLTGSGADISVLDNSKTLLMELLVDTQRYFDLHHTNNDVFEKVNKRELELGAATMAAMVYLLDNVFE